MGKTNSAQCNDRNKKPDFLVTNVYGFSKTTDIRMAEAKLIRMSTWQQRRGQTENRQDGHPLKFEIESLSISKL